jgi:hypothetical protein
MNVLLTIKSLYVTNGFVAVLLYLPQIYQALKDRQRARSLSLLTFGGWSVGSLITALYAWCYVRDPIFTAISLGNMVGSGAIFAIAAGSRMRHLKRVRISRRLRHFRRRLTAGHKTDRAAHLAQQLP